MERGSKKRGREGKELMAEGMGRVGGGAGSSTKARKQEMRGPAFDDGGDVSNGSGAGRALGVFEFPWQQQEGLAAAEPDGRDLLDVFFSSLVDGCSAAIGFPGDRLFRAPAAIPLPEEGDEDSSWPLDGEADGVDCIWSCALRQPLSAVYSKGSNT